MGNRSRFVVAIGSTAAGVMTVRGLQRRRRARPGGAAVPRDPAHAPGHRHLPLTDVLEQPDPPRVYERPFGKHQRGLRHPGKI